MDEAIKMEIRYQERGCITSKRAEETQYLFLDISRDPESIAEYQTQFEKDMRKAIGMFAKEKIWDCEITFYRCNSFYNESRYALVHREAGDAENDVYTFYKYGLNTSDKQKVSKAKLLKDLLELEREHTKSLLDNRQAS